MDGISENDLNHILKHSESCWRELEGAKLFLTGGTGLFGVWFLESMAWAQKQLGISFEVTVLSRNPDLFLKNYPQFKSFSFLKFHQGDIVDFSFPEGKFTHVIHAAATSAKATFNNEDPDKKFKDIVEGMRRVLEFSKQAGVRLMLYTSSGSVYGKQPTDMPLMLESYQGDPRAVDGDSALGRGKKAAEDLLLSYSKNIKKIKVARCFSFVGPHLPLDIHYAVGNFIADGLAGRPIHIRGDGKPIRSYLYMADLVIWLMNIFIKGQNLRIYNVGSEEAYSIASIAQKVGDHFKLPVEFAVNPTKPKTSASDLYVPSTARAKELGLKQWIDLKDGISRTIAFYQKI